MNKILLSILTLFLFSMAAIAGGDLKSTAGPGDKNPVIKSYPNPVTADVTIEIQLYTANQFSKVEIKIVNLLGQEMVPALHEDLSGITSSVKIDMRDVPVGIYFMEVTTSASDGSSYTYTKKITKN